MKALLPVAAFAMASAGAVSTSNSGSKTLAEVDGWRRTSPVSCEFVRKCNNISMALCSSGGAQLYGKPTPASYCTDILTHQP